MHQILTVVNKLKIRLLIKADLGWHGRANFVGKLFDSVYLWFVFALCGLIVFMVYSEPFQTSKMDIFLKIVTSNEITSLLRCWKEFRIHFC